MGWAASGAKARYVIGQRNARVTGKDQPMLLTLRERPGVFVPVAVWLVLTILAGLTGPFETYQLLAPGPRLAYWALIVGVSVLVDMGFRVLLRGQALGRRLAARLGFAILLGWLVHLINMAVFDGWFGWSSLAWLVGIVWVIAMAVEGLVALNRVVHTAQPTEQTDESPDASFQSRLPLDRRGTLVRLEAQDHYLKVVTDIGEALILMRLSDAETELAAFDGLRVHRSHWVAIGQVQKVQRREGRLMLTMQDGAEVPVSRTYRPGVEAAGLTV